jgi:drug/metabolite transporter (DMT)-like permease
MFIGEFCCIFAYLIRRQMQAKPKENADQTPLSPGTQMAQETKLKTKINPLYLAIPATCDICGSTLMFIALTQCAASVYQMMRGIIVLITAVLSILFLGKKQYAHHWLSLFTIVSGVCIVGLVGVTMSKDDTESTPTSFLGVLLLLLSQCFAGLQFISEEKILSGYYLDPLYVVGLEGFWGCVYYAILLPIFQQIKCDGALCHNGYLEDTKSAFK